MVKKKSKRQQKNRRSNQGAQQNTNAGKAHSRPKRDSRDQHQIGNHHIVPRSRSGPDAYWNSFSWGDADERQVKHPAWHDMFVNQLPSEAKEKINGWTTKNRKLDRSRMSEKQRTAWDAFFGRDTLPAQAKVWIERNFLPAEQKWKRGKGH